MTTSPKRANCSGNNGMRRLGIGPHALASAVPPYLPRICKGDRQLIRGACLSVLLYKPRTNCICGDCSMFTTRKPGQRAQSHLGSAVVYVERVSRKFLTETTSYTVHRPGLREVHRCKKRPLPLLGDLKPCVYRRSYATK